MESPLSLQNGQQSYPLPDSRGSIERSNGFGGRSMMDSMSLAGRKRKRGDFEVKTETPSDVVSKGLVSYEEAAGYFVRFFQGCVRFSCC